MLTPVMRVVLSLVDFGIQYEIWLYVVITGIVLFTIIIANSLVELDNGC